MRQSTERTDDCLLQRDLDRLAHLALVSWSELEQVRSTFVSRNLRLVVHIAKRYSRRGVPLLDLIQEANVGLMRRGALRPAPGPVWNIEEAFPAGA
jgi:DNA-directed RNA polymerase sigma subunit (sigma70/sigma32)